MSCYSERELWLFYDGRMKGEEKARLLSHLRVCDRCRLLWEEISNVGRTLESMNSREGSASRSAEKALGRYLRRKRMKRLGAAAGVAAVFMVSLVLGFWFLGGARQAVTREDSSSVSKRPDKAPGTGDGGNLTGDALAHRTLSGDGKAGGTRHGEGTRGSSASYYEFEWGAVKDISKPGALSFSKRTPEEVFVVLEEGFARFEVDPEAGILFQVETPDSRIEVYGTVFSVRVKAGENGRDTPATEVFVERGKVFVWAAGEKNLIEAGKSFSSAGPLPGSGVRRSPPEKQSRHEEKEPPQGSSSSSNVDLPVN